MKKLEKLLSGYKAFFSKYFISEKDLYKSLFKEQKPKFLVISCCDSRVDPSILTQAEPGDLFVVRNIANIVPPFCSNQQHYSVGAAIEFAVCVLKVTNIIILGHSGCKGVEAFFDNENDTHTFFINTWVNIKKETKNKIVNQYSDLPKSERLKLAELENIVSSINNLYTYPFVTEKIDKNELNLHGWYFSIENGSLSYYADETKTFVKF